MSLNMFQCYKNKYTFTATIWERYKPLEDNQVLPPIPNRNQIDERFPCTADSRWIVLLKFFNREEELYKFVLYFDKEPPTYDRKWLTWWERIWYRQKTYTNTPSQSRAPSPPSSICLREQTTALPPVSPTQTPTTPTDPGQSQ